MKAFYPSRIIVVTSILFLFACKTSVNKNEYVIKKGPFQATIMETGQLQAISAKAFTMPFIGFNYGYRQKIIYLPEHGEKVSIGDTIARIDPSSVIRTLEEQKNRLEMEQANLKKMQASQKSGISQINSDLLREESNYNLIKLQVDKFKFEPEKKQKIKQLELNQATIRLEQIKSKIRHRKTINRNVLNIQKIRISQIENKILAAKHALTKLIVTSPIEGIAQLERNWMTNQMVQIGDEIGQGWPMISLPDMSAMKVTSTINETDIHKITLNQPVIIRLDAYPELKFSGKIKQIGKLSHRKSRDSQIKVFYFEIAVIDNDEALKPGMTVSCEIVLAEFDKVLYVPNNCIVRENSSYYLYYKKSGEYLPRQIKILGRNNEFSAVSGDIKKGDKIIPRSELTEINLKNEGI